MNEITSTYFRLLVYNNVPNEIINLEEMEKQKMIEKLNEKNIKKMKTILLNARNLKMREI